MVDFGSIIAIIFVVIAGFIILTFLANLIEKRISRFGNRSSNLDKVRSVQMIEQQLMGNEERLVVQELEAGSSKLQLLERNIELSRNFQENRSELLKTIEAILIIIQRQKGDFKGEVEDADEELSLFGLEVKDLKQEEKELKNKSTPQSSVTLEENKKLLDIANNKFNLAKEKLEKSKNMLSILSGNLLGKTQFTEAKKEQKIIEKNKLNEKELLDIGNYLLSSEKELIVLENRVKELLNLIEQLESQSLAEMNKEMDLERAA